MENIANTENLLVWDLDEEPPVGQWKVVLWQGFASANDTTTISIPAFVEERGLELRAWYLRWIHDLGQKSMNGKRLIDHLELRRGFSYWWMTSLVQKFNSSETSQIENAIKAYAFEKLVSEHKPQSVVLVSANSRLAATLNIFCRQHGALFKWNRPKICGKRKSIARRIYDLLPCPLRALISFSRYFLTCMPLLMMRDRKISLFEGKITFIDVLVHLDKKTFATQTFISNYWTTLVEKLLLLNISTNWLHNFFPQELIPTPVKAQNLIDRFNQGHGRIQAHALIEKHLCLQVFLNSFAIYLKLFVASFRISISSKHFQPADSALSLWLLLKDEWINSLRGPEAIHSCLRVSLYEKVFQSLPRQDLGVYIQENQPWEMSLIHAWKGAGHGKLIGVPHTTVRFWDLRYFYDCRSYEHSRNNALPRPDLVAVNGPVAKKIYLDAGYPEHEVIEVEALRFPHLLKYKSPSRKCVNQPGTALRVLVCGEFLSGPTLKLLSWLAIAARDLPCETSYLFKPHPAYPIKTNALPPLRLEVTDAPLTNLFSKCDVLFTGNNTSAAVDAFCSGIPVIQMMDGSSFNMSPLRGLEGVVYATKPKELLEALRNIQHLEVGLKVPYFCLNEDLPRWKQLLKETSG